MDRLTKSAHFLPVRLDYSMDRLAELYVNEIVRLHGIPLSIVSDRNPRFALRFWKELQLAFGTRLNFSTAFHPQIDGQSKRVIQVLEDMLRGCVLDFSEVGIGIFHSWNFPIATVISPILVWPRMKLCMAENVELLCVG